MDKNDTREKMTKDKLDQYLEKKIVPMIKDVVSDSVADIVAAAVAKALPAAPVPGAVGGHTGAFTIKEIRERMEKGLPFGKAVRAMAFAKMNSGGYDQALQALKAWGDPELADCLKDTKEKAMAAGEPTAGGFLVPEQFSQDVIELLRPMTVVRRLGPMTLPMPTGTMRVPKITSGTQAGYIGENQNAPKTELGTGQVTLTWRKLAAIVPISNDLLRYSSPGADALVRDDVVRAMSQRENQAFLRGAGSDAAPKGLRSWCPAANIVAAGTPGLAQATTDLGQLILKLKNNNVPMTRPAWIMSPRSEHYLMTVQTTDGWFVYRPEMLTGRLWGFPYAVTTEVPDNLNDGGNGDESEVYLVDFADALIGEAQRIVVDSSSEAAYHDGNVVVAAYSQDQTVIRAIAEHDFVMRRDAAVALLHQVRWSA